MRKYFIDQIIFVNGQPFKIIGVRDALRLEVVSVDEVPEGFKPAKQIIYINQVDK